MNYKTILYEKYGAERVFDTPISELAMTGAAYGAAVTGLRPVLEIMFGDFIALGYDQIVTKVFGEKAQLKLAGK